MNFILALFFVGFSYSFGRTLIQVQVLTRHGHTTPGASAPEIPNCPYDFTEMWEGIGVQDLTPIGEEQAYYVGEFIRDVYLEEDSEYHVEGVTTEYDENLFFFASSERARTLATSAAVIQGMFNDVEDTSSIPTEVYADEAHDMVLLEQFVCPIWKINTDAFFHQDPVVMYYNQKYMDELNEGLGLEIMLDDIAYYNAVTLMILEEAGVLCPEIEDLVPLMYEAQEVFDRKRFGEEDNPPFVGAAFLDEILYRMEQTIEDNNEPKIIHYSAHMQTVYYLLLSLGLSTDYSDLFAPTPGFAASVYIELWRDDETGKLYVEVLYQNPYNSETVERLFMSRLGCGGFACDYEHFSTVIGEYIDATSEEEVEEICSAAWTEVMG